MTELTNIEESYLLLAIAIVKQAADDYRSAYRRFLKSGTENPTMKKIEHWLLHGDGIILSFNKGEYILRVIREQEDKKYKNGVTSSHVFTYNGITLNAQGWADKLGVHRSTIYRRMALGLPPEQVFAPPLTRDREDSQ